MKQGQKLAIWLHDAAAKIFLGLEANREVSRWVAVGTVLDMQSPIGVWVDVSHVEERRRGTKGEKRTKAWTVKPSQCLIRWDYIISAQALDEVAEVPKNQRSAPGFL